MKKTSPLHPVRSLLLLTTGLWLANVPAAAQSAPPLPAEILLAEIKTAPYADREALKAKLQAAETRFGDRIPEWEAMKNNLPEKQKMAADVNFKQLVRLREDLRHQIDGVQGAQAATWNSAKHTLEVSLQNTIQTFKQLQLQFEPAKAPVAAPAPLRAPTGPALLPAEILLAEIKSTPYADRAALKVKIQEVERRFYDRIPEWEARANNLPEQEKIAANVNLKQLIQMREPLRQKIDGVEGAEEATWNSAKQSLYVSLQNAIQAFKKLQVQFGT